MGLSRLLSHRLEYAAVASLRAALRLLPRPPALAAGSALGRMVGGLLARRRRIVDENLAAAFPDWTPADRIAVARRVWANLGRFAAEFARAPLSESEGSALVQWEGQSYLADALGRGRGAICPTGHFGAWETLPRMVAGAGYDVAVVAQAQSNPMVEALILRTRAAGGFRVLYQDHAVRESLKHLKRNGVLGILIDQHLWEGTIRVPFLGRAAATTTMVAAVARRTGAAIVPTGIRWATAGGAKAPPGSLAVGGESGNRHVMWCEPEIEVERTDDAEADVRRATERVSAVLERWIRAWPDQWFWVHRRWKG